jgi:hypothetical protein
MVVISNSQRDEAVRYLQRLADLTEGDGSTKAVNLRRLARRLARQLEKKEKQAVRHRPGVSS